MKRVTKKQLIAKLEVLDFGKAHTLRKIRLPLNGVNRYGWWIDATNGKIYGWRFLGNILAEAMSYLEIRERHNS